MMIVNIPGSGSLTCASRVAPPKVNWAAPSTRVNSTSIICPSISSSIFIGAVLLLKFEERTPQHAEAGRGSRIEDRGATYNAIFDLQSSILDLQSSILDLRSYFACCCVLFCLFKQLAIPQRPAI